MATVSSRPAWWRYRLPAWARQAWRRYRSLAWARRASRRYRLPAWARPASQRYQHSREWRFQQAEQRLLPIREIDAAHFSHPQLLLFEIHVRQGDPHAAADDLDDFLTHHPDWPRAEAARKTIAELRSR